MVVSDALAPVPYFLPGSTGSAHYSMERHRAGPQIWKEAQVLTIEPGEDGIVYGPDGQKVSGAPPGHLIDIYA